MPHALPVPNTGMTAAEAIAQARDAATAGAWDNACDRWAQVRKNFPDEAAGYNEGARALETLGMHAAAGAVLADGIRALPRDRDLLVAYAHNANRLGDWPGAVVRWAALRDAFPDFWLGYAGGVAALRQCRRPEDATALVALGLQRCGDEPELLFERARVAEALGDWHEAAARWLHVRSMLPDHWIGYVSGGHSLRQANRLPEAASLLEAGQARLPDEPRMFTEHARLAEAQGQWPEAAIRWATVRRRFPMLPEAYAAGANALLKAGDAGSADTVIAEGLLRLPDAQGLWFEAARLADRRRDSEDAVALWSEIVRRFPDQPAGYLGHAIALRDRGRLDAAEAVLTAAWERHPDDRGLTTERAIVAHRRGDMSEAVRRWELALTRMPDSEMAYLMLADALRSVERTDDAEARLLEAIARFPDRIEPSLAYARLADAAGDNGASLKRWRDALARFPDRMDCHLAVVAALRKNNETEAADAALVEAIDRFPDAWEPLADRASNAMQRNDWDIAVPCYAALRERFPDRVAGFVGGAQAELNRGRLEEAEATIVDAIARFPDDPTVPLLHAHMPIHPFARPKNPAEAVRRVDAILARFPDNVFVARIALQLRRDAMYLDDAAALSETLAARFPDNIDLMTECAAISVALGNWPDAIERLRALVSREPRRADIAVRLGETLLRAEKLDEAEQSLRDTMSRHPGEPGAHIQYGAVAARRNDWPEAIRRWEQGAQRFPHRRDFQVRIFEANLRLTEAEPGAENPAAAPAPAPQATEALSDRALMMQFESLGGSGHGCEFGLAQRNYGAEPLGLLRWSDLGDDCEGLIRALECQLDGIGEPEHTVLELIPSNGRNEYWTKDRRYWMVMRGFVFEDEIEYDKMFVQACRRLRFLREELIEDLAAGDKIFVYRNMWRDLTDDELGRLRAAMQDFGPNWLLYIRFADELHPFPSVEIREPGLMVGYIDHFGSSPTDLPLGNAAPSFLALCRLAHALWMQQRDAAV